MHDFPFGNRVRFMGKLSMCLVNLRSSSFLLLKELRWVKEFCCFQNTHSGGCFAVVVSFFIVVLLCFFFTVFPPTQQERKCELKNFVSLLPPQLCKTVNTGSRRVAKLPSQLHFLIKLAQEENWKIALRVIFRLRQWGWKHEQRQFLADARVMVQGVAFL